MSETENETADDQDNIDAETQPEREAKERLDEFSSAVERLQDGSDSDCDPGCGC